MNSLTSRILPFDEQDRVIIENSEGSAHLALTPDYRPNWTHAYVFRREAFQNPSLSDQFDEFYGAALGGQVRNMIEYQILYTPEFIYLFTCNRPRHQVKGYTFYDRNLVAMADEVIGFHNFLQRGRVKYAKCRSENIKGLGNRIHKGKFFREFMERTELAINTPIPKG